MIEWRRGLIPQRSDDRTELQAAENTLGEAYSSPELVLLIEGWMVLGIALSLFESEHGLQNET